MEVGGEKKRSSETSNREREREGEFVNCLGERKRSSVARKREREDPL